MESEKARVPLAMYVEEVLTMTAIYYVQPNIFDFKQETYMICHGAKSFGRKTIRMHLNIYTCPSY
jgi:hypothetical protein